MAGTKTGAKKAAETNKRKWGEDFYKNIGKIGGSSSKGGLKGFAANRELAMIAGSKGGKVSRRRKKEY